MAKRSRSLDGRTADTQESTIREHWRVSTRLSTPYFIVTSSLIHTQFAYAAVNYNLNSYSNNEPPHTVRSQKVIVFDRHRSDPKVFIGRRE